MPNNSEYIDRIKELNPHLNAYLFVDEEAKSSPGLSIAVKDNIMVKGWQATASSKILEGFISPYDATVIKRLKTAGMNLLGKTNLDEFAMGSSTENSAYGVTRNPWDLDKVPGGSSGGSAAAVAAGLCDAALGSDTAGSIRQPAAFCGITGLKPTYGSVSRYGLIALTSSIDVIGPFARDAKTIEEVFAAISGKDENDQTTFDYQYKEEKISLKGLRIGLPQELWDLDIDPEIAEHVRAFIRHLEMQGAVVSSVSLPYLSYGLPAYYVITPAEVSANLARFDGIRYQKSVNEESLIDVYKNTRHFFGPEVKRRILLGAFVLSVGHYDSYYETAVRVKNLITTDYERVFRSVDVLVTPTTPSLPFGFGDKVKDPVKMYQSDLMTVSANLAGIPAISIPCGMSESGLPIGVQIMAPYANDARLISLAKTYQEQTDFHKEQPNVTMKVKSNG